MRVLLCTEGEDLLHPIDLLPQEDVHRDEAAEPSQGVLHLVRHVIPGKFPQHVLRYLKHERFPGRTKSCVGRGGASKTHLFLFHGAHVIPPLVTLSLQPCHLSFP